MLKCKRHISDLIWSYPVPDDSLKDYNLTFKKLNK